MIFWLFGNKKEQEEKQSLAMEIVNWLNDMEKEIRDNPSAIDKMLESDNFKKTEILLSFMTDLEKLLSENDISNDIYFLIEGECQVFHKEKKVGILYAGNIFGESGVIFKTKRNASVVCASKTATLLTFKIDEESNEFTTGALATLYKNLALQINTKLETLNSVYIHKHPF